MGGGGFPERQDYESGLDGGSMEKILVIGGKEGAVTLAFALTA